MQIRIRVGAARDSSFDQVFKSIVSASKEANARVTADERKNITLQEKMMLEKWSQQKMILAEEIRETSKVHDHQRRLETMAAKTKLQLRELAAKQSADRELAIATESAKAKTAIEVAQAKEAFRKTREIEVASAKAAMRAQAGGPGSGGPGGRGRDFAYRMGYWASRNLSPVTPMLAFGQRMASDIVRGAGVDFNFGNLISNRVQAEKQAVALSNAAFMPGAEGAAGQRQDPRTLMREVKAAADATGFGRNEGLDALQKFVGVSGDLETGRAVLKDMATLARATDSSLDDMVEAAGNAANQLGDTKDKGAQLHAIMAAVAGQGKIGAVEIKDMARQMAALAAQAPMFGGNPADNIMMMGVLAQEARQRGGAKSAAQATTAVTSFVNTLTKGARLKEMMAAGVISSPEEIRTLGPQELIMRMLQKTQGKELPMNKLVMDVQAKRAIRGFQILYNQAGGGEAGIKAVAAEFDRLKKATMGNAEIQDSFKAAMDTTTTKAQLFQNKLQDVADSMAEKALPALDRLAPVALSVVGALGSLVGTLADNPLTVIPVALGAAIAKSGAEQAVRVGIENIFRNFTTGGPVGLAGNAAAALTIAATAVTIAEVGMLYIDKVMDDESKKQRKAIGEQITAVNAESDYRAALREYNKEVAAGAPTPEAAKRLEETKNKLRSAAEGLKPEEGPGFLKSLMEALLNTSGGPMNSAEAGFVKPNTGTNPEVEAEQKRRHQESIAVQKESARLLALIAGSNGPLAPIDGGNRTGVMSSP